MHSHRVVHITVPITAAVTNSNTVITIASVILLLHDYSFYYYGYYY